MNLDLPKNKKFKIRYGRDKNNAPKNALVTTQDGENIFFGISRCKSKVDRVNKKIGRYIAYRRMEDATQLNMDSLKGLGDKLFYTNLCGYNGIVHITRVKELLHYFDKIEHLKSEETSYQREPPSTK